MSPAQVAALGALVVAAGLGVSSLEAHYDARDAQAALRYARSAQFGPTTKARVGTYLRALHPDLPMDWRARPGEGEAEIEVRLSVGRQTYRFAVTVESRRVEPMDGATRTLIEQVRGWAAK